MRCVKKYQKFLSFGNKTHGRSLLYIEPSFTVMHILGISSITDPLGSVYFWKQKKSHIEPCLSNNGGWDIVTVIFWPTIGMKKQLG